MSSDLDFIVFISYAQDHPDSRARALLLHERLTREGCTVFVDINIAAGVVWEKHLEANIARAHALVLVWSKQASRSEWVGKETQKFSERREDVLILIDCLDSTELPEALRGFQLLTRPGEDDREELVRRIFRALPARIARLTGDLAEARRSLREESIRRDTADARHHAEIVELSAKRAEMEAGRARQEAQHQGRVQELEAAAQISAQRHASEAAAWSVNMERIRREQISAAAVIMLFGLLLLVGGWVSWSRVSACEATADACEASGREALRDCEYSSLARGEVQEERLNAIVDAFSVAAAKSADLTSGDYRGELTPFLTDIQQVLAARRSTNGGNSAAEYFNLTVLRFVRATPEMAAHLQYDFSVQGDKRDPSRRTFYFGESGGATQQSAGDKVSVGGVGPCSFLSGQTLTTSTLNLGQATIAERVAASHADNWIVATLGTPPTTSVCTWTAGTANPPTTDVACAPFGWSGTGVPSSDSGVLCASTTLKPGDRAGGAGVFDDNDRRVITFAASTLWNSRRVHRSLGE